jgi:hypothetical protein
MRQSGQSNENLLMLQTLVTVSLEQQSATQTQD